MLLSGLRPVRFRIVGRKPLSNTLNYISKHEAQAQNLKKRLFNWNDKDAARSSFLKLFHDLPEGIYLDNRVECYPTCFRKGNYCGTLQARHNARNFLYRLLRYIHYHIFVLAGGEQRPQPHKKAVN